MWTEVEHQITPIVDRIETLRKESVPKIWRYTLLIGAGIAVVCLLVLIFIFGIKDALATTPLLIGVVVIALIGSFVGTYYHYYNVIVANYKDEIMPRLVASVCDDGQYVSDGGISEYVFKASDLFYWDNTTYLRQEDYIRGVIGRTDFEFCEAELGHEETTTDRKGHTTTHEVTDFKGMVFNADFNKHFSGKTIVSTSYVATFKRRIKLESVDFNKKFRTYCTDEMEARYILTPALQERLLTLLDTMKNTINESSIQMTFNQNRLAIFISSYKDRFEPTMFRKMTIERVEKDFTCIKAIAGIVEDLNLNTRIWTKE